MKANYKTSEFWFTLVSFVISGLFLSGVITDNDTKDELIEVIAHAVESVFLISGQIVILYRYINSRNQQKIEYEKRKSKEDEELEKELEDYIGIDKEIININTASVGELIKLPNIGPATAKKIVRYRKENGDFKDTKQIIKINGVGKSTYFKIKENIRV